MVRFVVVVVALGFASASVASDPPTLVRVDHVPPYAPKNGPYQNGHLVRSAFVELAGTARQIKAIKAYAVPRGWRIDCEGKTGSLNTLRLRFPTGTRQTDIEGYFMGNLMLPSPARKI